ncbi:bifunctional hydroxyacyl-CoA dehydrogenase/enoyl-CoA hydratase FOX2 [Sugiyamaella lignohabitans]|uniref:Peroxisomal hydratase-dehydrogenase-epimerase n=1 Tax=Sugiyamaella lignohabitans TaxID=796027 RepID=A0A167D5H7_9ASCO|nr:bifunctional hydroxyacyl-CoA dehydrogenase/enoyl-CoA hydratase FOX2 [Sugiyamaella lignohabitans]ANB12509.1 bifunctional hydroxyacyl-CoA dehydrogenase/enoyl-CoA hydratase FOX2 [Sugiyamaella lignohabitans]
MGKELRFDDKVVVITGAGGGLGKAYALFFGARGASVVVNDLGGSLKGETDGDATGKRVADGVVDEIIKLGGKAVANYDSVEFGDKIVETAIKAFGTVHIVINNAGILRDVSFKNMKDQDFKLVQLVHVYGSYKVAKAAWPHMRKQKFGRIINTASAAGLYGNFGQTNYSAAKLALVGFTETLAKEGAKYNITANAIVPIAASRMTETILPPDVLDKLKPEYVVPVVGYLVHENTKDTWGIYEVGAGAVTKLRWQRAKGALFKGDDSFTPSAVLKKWDEINDFSAGSEFPNGSKDLLAIAESSPKLPPNAQGEPVEFKDKVVIVTGGGAGIGRAYSLLLAKLGAKVVVNDLGNPQAVVDEIKAAGGIAVADKHSVTDGPAVVKTAIDAFGAVHVVINNAGIIRDKSFANISDQEWNIIQDVHLFGTYSVTKAAWPYLLKQKYGRVINTASTSGIYGNFGQSNYAAAKLGILGFSRALALEGQKYNILVNTIAPTAGTNMTSSVFTEEMLEQFKPQYIAPLVGLLASDKAPVTGHLFETGAGWIARTRWQRTGGHAFNVSNGLPIESVAAKWEKITNFDDGRATYPENASESNAGLFELAAEAESLDPEPSPAPKDIGVYEYDDKKIILYNLGVGAGAKDLKYTYEGDDDFGPVPSFGVIPSFTVHAPLNDLVPNFNPMMLLHGEQFLEIKKWPIPPATTLLTELNVLDVIDKGKAAIVTTETVSRDKETGDAIFYNVSSVFIRGSGGFGGKTKAEDRGPITAANKPPSRAPDFEASYKTSVDQAAIYRLSGDFNPLHIDPDFAAVGNFPQPILHGLATMGISSRLLVEKFGVFKNIKVRFTGHVFPGETLKVVGWKEGNKVIFETRVVERGTTAISAAAIELLSNGQPKL